MSLNSYEQQVELMLRIMPIVAQSSCFALKGGTAINFFLQEMPRLSVDIDLTYLPLEPRELALPNINRELRTMRDKIKSTYPTLSTKESISKDGSMVTRIFIQSENAKIKIEPNFVLRGTVQKTQLTPICETAQEKYNVFIEMSTLSQPELYAGKICAALDRQHPRDLFDIKMLYENGGINDDIRKLFLVYLASSPRPMHELLNPNQLDLKHSFNNEFSGMTTTNINLKELLFTREQFVSDIRSQLTKDEKEFLLSIKSGLPQWQLMPFQNLDQLPGLQWKLLNIQKMNKNKKLDMLNKLEKVLS